MTDALRIFFPEKEVEIEDIIVELSRRLRRALGNLLVGVESYEGPDGENVRIIVREKTWEIIDKIMDEIWRIEVERSVEGKIIPQIISLSEHIHDASWVRGEKLPDQIIVELSRRLRRALGNLLVGVESYEGPDGENVRIIVREKTWEIIDKIMDEIWRIEVERNMEGEIIPSIEVSA